MTTQLITPNPAIACRPGMCLEYVRKTFDLPIRYGSATEAWNNSPSQHPDQDFPAGCWVPIWFAIDIEPNGHVALLAPDGTVYSSSDNGNIPHHHPSIADLINYYAYWGKMTLTFLGWSEDVAGYPVISLTDSINFQSTPTEQDWLDMATKDDVKAALDELLNEQRPDAEGIPTSIRDLVFISRSMVHDVPNQVMRFQVPRPEGGTNTLGWSLGAEKGRMDAIPNAVLNFNYRENTNLAGALDAAAKTSASSVPATVDVDALVARLKAELPAATVALLAQKLA